MYESATNHSYNYYKIYNILKHAYLVHYHYILKIFYIVFIIVIIKTRFVIFRENILANLTFKIKIFYISSIVYIQDDFSILIIIAGDLFISCFKVFLTADFAIFSIDSIEIFELILFAI